MSNTKIIALLLGLLHTGIFFLGEPNQAQAQTTTTSPDSKLECGPSVNTVMPSVVLDYVRISSALDSGSLRQFKSMSYDLTQKMDSVLNQDEVIDRGPASVRNACQTIPKSILKQSRSMFRAASVADARTETRILSQLIAEWAFLFQRDERKGGGNSMSKPEPR